MIFDYDNIFGGGIKLEEIKLSWESAFIALVNEIIESITSEEPNIGVKLIAKTFELIDKLGDQEKAINLLAGIVERNIPEQIRSFAVAILATKAHVILSEEVGLDDTLIALGVAHLKERALKSTKPTEKPETPEEHEHGAVSEG